MPAEPEFLSVPETAALLRIGERTVYKLVRQGDLPALKVGGQWRVHRPTLLEWARGRHMELSPLPRDEGRAT